jgi:hypothetical protein
MRVEEDVARPVGRLAALREDGGVQGTAELVGAECIEAAVLDKGRRGGHRIEHPLNAGTDGRRCRGASTAGRRPACAREVEQVGPLGLVECSASASASSTLSEAAPRLTRSSRL